MRSHIQQNNAMNATKYVDIFDFLYMTDSCNLGYEQFNDYRYTELDLLKCPPPNWNDGICDEGCNNQLILYDGGDCGQLCDLNQCNIDYFIDN